MNRHRYSHLVFLAIYSDTLLETWSGRTPDSCGRKIVTRPWNLGRRWTYVSKQKEADVCRLIADTRESIVSLSRPWLPTSSPYLSLSFCPRPATLIDTPTSLILSFSLLPHSLSLSLLLSLSLPFSTYMRALNPYHSLCISTRFPFIRHPFSCFQLFIPMTLLSRDPRCFHLFRLF